MKIAVSAGGPDLTSSTSPRFGRCECYVLVDTETMAAEALPNSASAAAHGAGVGAAQFVMNQGAHAVITGNVGPNAFHVLNSANVPVYVCDGGTVAEAIAAFKTGALKTTGAATAGGHGGAIGRGAGGGRGKG